MNPTYVVNGRYVGRTFIPDEPLPAVEGTARLIIVPVGPAVGSVFELFGKAAVLRTGDDIATQLQEERDAWGEP